MSIDSQHQSGTTSANVATMFFDRVEKSAQHEAFRKLEGGEWTSLTWRQAADQVEALAGGLLALGIEPEQRVGIASSTRYEWILADLAIMCAGGATTTVYPTTNAADTAYILSDSESRFVFAEDESQLEKLRDRRDELPHLEKVLLFDGAGDGDWVIGLADVIEMGRKHLEQQRSQRGRSNPYRAKEGLIEARDARQVLLRYHQRGRCAHGRPVEDASSRTDQHQYVDVPYLD